MRQSPWLPRKMSQTVAKEKIAKRTDFWSGTLNLPYGWWRMATKSTPARGIKGRQLRSPMGIQGFRAQVPAMERWRMPRARPQQPPPPPPPPPRPPPAGWKLSSSWWSWRTGRPGVKKLTFSSLSLDTQWIWEMCGDFLISAIKMEEVSAQSCSLFLNDEFLGL